MKKTYPYMLIIGSLIGLLASFFLMLDTITLIKNPTAEIPCNLNPFISCGNAILSEQGQVFGFPNPILGLISFSLLFGLGLALAYHVIPEDPSSTKLHRTREYFWTLVNYGVLASFIFVVWFFYQSLYNLRTLCLYCMIVWSVTWPLFLYTTIWNIKENHFSLNKINKNLDGLLSKYHLQILITVYLVAILFVLYKFQDFFLS